MTSLFPPRESLVSDIPAGDGTFEQVFLRCTMEQLWETNAKSSLLDCSWNQLGNRVGEKGEGGATNPSLLTQTHHSPPMPMVPWYP
jgi:hypothetical protein